MIENKSLADLKHKKIILELQLLGINQKLARRKDKSRSVLNLRDKFDNPIHVGDKVWLLSKSSKTSPFRGVREAVVLGTVHTRSRVKIGLISTQDVYTDRISSNLAVIQNNKQETSSKETRRV